MSGETGPDEQCKSAPHALCTPGEKLSRPNHDASALPDYHGLSCRPIQPERPIPTTQGTAHERTKLLHEDLASLPVARNQQHPPLARRPPTHTFKARGY
eukprot:7587178-Alexandrium_andersonii.AAC.1